MGSSAVEFQSYIWIWIEMFKPLLQGEILQRIVSLWQTPISQIQAAEQMLPKAARIFWSVTTDRFSDRKQRERLLSKLSCRKY